jgi:hypothetical protein
MTNDQDAGAFIGHEPEFASERIPGGVRPQDERVATTQSEPAGPGEPAGDTSDVVEGPIGSASLKEPATSEALAADLDALNIETDQEPAATDSHQ